MSKGRDRPGKETRKPKAEKNKKKKGAATPPVGGRGEAGAGRRQRRQDLTRDRPSPRVTLPDA